MMISNRSDAETKFRKSQRCLFILLLLFIPVTLVASKLSDLLHSDLVFGLTEAGLMIGFVVVSVWVYVAHIRLTGKYPFYWLFRK